MKAICLLIIITMVILNILLHECGHYIAAKRAGLHISRFQVGMGKPVISWEKNGTQFGISPLLFGGFVDYDDKEAERLPYLKQMTFLIGGCAMNLLLAFLEAVAGLVIAGRANGIVSTVVKALGFMWSAFTGFISTLGSLIASLLQFDKVDGVIGTFGTLCDAAANAGTEVNVQIGAAFIVSALISIVFAVGNLLPIPSLDGGQVITETLVRIGYKFNCNFRPAVNRLNSVCLMVVMILSVLAFLPDLIRI